MEHRRASWFVSLLAAVLATGCVNAAQAGTDVGTAGDVLRAVIPAVAVGASVLHDDGGGLAQFAGAAALTIGVTYGLKHVVDAERPNGGEDSFPSGHASLSFCSAEFLRRRYGRAWGLPAYAVAGFIGYSRVEAEEHYGRDVVAGAIIGAASAWALTRPFERVSVDVVLLPDGCALSMGCVW